MEQIIDIVGEYPVRNQVALYMTLHYADMALPASVLRDFLPFDDDLYRLVEILSAKGADEQIAPVVESLGKDLKLLYESYMGVMANLAAYSTTRNDEESMLSFVILCAMLENILREFHTMRAEDINALLDDMEREGDSLHFNAIEAFSDKHLLAAERFMADDMKAFMKNSGK